MKSYYIETKRLKLIFLKIEELESLLDGPSYIENTYNAKYEADEINSEMLSVFQIQLALAKENTLHYLFHTMIMYLDKVTNIFVGSACFKNFPYDGRVEIGYGIGTKHQNNGYATEGLKALANWCIEKNYIPYLEVEKWNIASMKVASKCGFKIYNSNEISNFYEI